MKTLNFNEMVEVTGGSWETFVDGACTGWGAVRIFGYAAGPAALAVDIGCVGWFVYRGLS